MKRLGPRTSLVCLTDSTVVGWEGRGQQTAEADDLQEDGARSQDSGRQAERYRERSPLGRVTRPDHVSVSSPIFPAFVLYYFLTAALTCCHKLVA